MHQRSFTFILQSLVPNPRAARCAGYVQTPLMQPTRLLLVGEPGASTNLDRLFVALKREFSPLSPGGTEACAGPGDLDCWATTAPAARNILVVIAGNDPPGSPLEDLVQESVNRGFEVFGFFKSGLDPDVVLPAALRTRLAGSWRNDVREIAGEILDIALLGAEDRRIFISYARKDGSPTAERLATILTELRFDVFLDRFQIPPGADLLERISDELTDKAMVVVVETPESVQSAWVQYEVSEAKSRRLGLAAVNVSGVTPLQEIDEMDRCRSANEQVLAKFLLDQHRTQMSERRQNLMQSVWRSLSRHVGRAGVQPTADGFHVQVAAAQYAIAVRPRPADLHRFRITHEQAGTAAPVIIHPQPKRADRRRDLEWLSVASNVSEVDEGRIDQTALEIAQGQL